MEQLRSVEILQEDGSWKKLKFTDIKNGETFRMFEPNGLPVVGKNEQTEFLAVSEVYQQEKGGVWTVVIEGEDDE